MYSEWRACERFGIIPEGLHRKWDDIDLWKQTLLIAYDFGRQIEDMQDAASQGKIA